MAKKRSPLSRQRVLEGAVSLADRVGVEALTIRKLATELEVKPMTIYHHVPNKDAILDGMVAAVFAEIHLPAPGSPWKSALRQRCASARRVLARHPWATPLMESRRKPGPATLRHHDTVLGFLRSGGFSLELAAHAYALLDAFVYGFALQEASLPATSGEDLSELAAEIATDVSLEDYPYLLEFTTEHVTRPDYDFAREFDFGLELILSALERALEASQA